MNISLNNEEIEIAIINYIESQGISMECKIPVVNVIAGRGDNGFRAEVDIREEIPSTAVIENSTPETAEEKEEDTNSSLFT